MRFEVDVEERGAGVQVLTIVGDADLYTVPQLRERLLAAVEAGATTLVVDLTRTTFIDSTTLGALIGAVKRLRPAGGEVWIVASDRSIRKIFEITLLDRVFPIFESREEALARFEPVAEGPGSGT
jgi:anti-sigma B factor antagonist